LPFATRPGSKRQDPAPLTRALTTARSRAIKILDLHDDEQL
jgi:hypothetical protein